MMREKQLIWMMVNCFDLLGGKQSEHLKEIYHFLLIALLL